LSGRRLLLGVRVVRILLVRFVMAHDAAGCGAQLAVSRHMAGGAADDGAFDAALGVRNGDESEGNRGCASRCHNPRVLLPTRRVLSNQPRQAS